MEIARMRPGLKFPFLLALAMGPVGCGDTGPGDEAVLESASRTLSPSDAGLADIYDRSCRSCHTVAATGAPLTGDAASWAIRMEKGMSTLVDNVINGFGGMPPLGMCMDCSAEEFEALIVFMASPG
jgi:cytochrome c5